MRCQKFCKIGGQYKVKITNRLRFTTRRPKLLNLQKHANTNVNRKCNEQRQKTSDKCSMIMCGDIELNPGPDNSSMSVLTTTLAQIGLEPVSIVGDSNCFFHSVSHQFYRTEARHFEIRSLAIQHLIKCPEHFIESNTDQSWLQYL